MPAEHAISTFSGENYFLSNFSPSVIWYDGYEWPTSEHVFQAMKSPHPEYRTRIRVAPTPQEAKRRGRSALLRGDWEQVKRAIMLRIVLAKFEQNPQLAERLAATGASALVEGNWWGDIFWGAVEYEGKGWRPGLREWHLPADADGPQILYGANWLGRTLMMVRDVLTADTP